MKNQRSIRLPLFLITSIAIAATLFYAASPVTSQTPNNNLNPNTGRPSRKAIQLSPRPTPTPTPESSTDVVKVDVDLVKIDALVLQKNTARIVGGLQKEDFQLYEDGIKQEITHFSQDQLPLSVLIAIDRGPACPQPLDVWSDETHRAAREAIDRLKPVDEIAVMAFTDDAELIQPFTRNRIMIENALNKIPEPAKTTNVAHCFNLMFADAAEHMLKASNPAGRRVIIVITSVTRLFDCPNGPSGRAATAAVYESGAVVCSIIPKVLVQRIENAKQIVATRVNKIVAAHYMDLENLANETGGEVLGDKPEKLGTTFQTLIDHLRSRYNMAFVSTNKKRDGTTRKLKLDIDPARQKPPGKLVIKARRSYIAPRS
ncbi:MAG TPA: VWA domain-containing protein [Pyrinomonadaceae bacterium]|nr:VWA domain-containing protein [Pyrinomonadaceae bacterium]